MVVVDNVKYLLTGTPGCIYLDILCQVSTQAISKQTKSLFTVYRCILIPKQFYLLSFDSVYYVQTFYYTYTCYPM